MVAKAGIVAAHLLRRSPDGALEEVADLVKLFRCGPMRLAFRISLFAIGLASLLGAGAGSAGTLVEFPNLPGHTPANLSGYLARPDSGLSAEVGGPSNGGAPYPAGVLKLHGLPLETEQLPADPTRSYNHRRQH